MSGSYGTGLQSITGSVSVAVGTSLPQTSASQTFKSFYALSNGASAVTLGTPTAGKVFHCTNLILSNINTTTVRKILFYDTDGSTRFIDVYLTARQTLSIAMYDKTYTNAQPLKFNAGEAGAADEISVTMLGYEVTA